MKGSVSGGGGNLGIKICSKFSKSQVTTLFIFSNWVRLSWATRWHQDHELGPEGAPDGPLSES